MYFKNDEDRKTIPTRYAVAQGAIEDILRGVYCMWWLRSPAPYKSIADYVDDDGSLRTWDVNVKYISVRPAFWLDLDSADIY